MSNSNTSSINNSRKSINVLQFDHHEFNDSIAEKLERELDVVSALFVQLVGQLPSTAGTGSNANALMIRDIDVIGELLQMLCDDSTSSSTRAKILDELIKLFTIAPQNCTLLFMNNITSLSSSNNYNTSISSTSTPSTTATTTTTSSSISSITTTTSILNIGNNSSSGRQRSLSITTSSSAVNSTGSSVGGGGGSGLKKSTTLCINRNVILLDEIIDLLPKIENERILSKILTLIEVLACHHISVLQLKQLLSYFDLSNPKSLKSAGLPQLLKCLDTMTMRKAPTSVFNFDGMNSGLLLDPIGKISNVGYSISIWINIDTFASRSKSMSNYEPRILSFLDEKGSGIEVFFVKGQLVVRINSKFETRIEKPFETNLWRHLVIQQAPSKWTSLFKQQSPLTIYLDGKQIHTVEIKYPSTSKPLTICSIGTVHSSINNQISQCCIRSQMGPICFMAGVLTDKKIEKLYRMGANMVLSPQQKNNMALSEHFPKILFSFSPKSYHGGICHDVGHQKESDSILNAHSTGNLRILSTFSIKDSLYCLGGPKMLFPLISQMIDKSATQSQQQQQQQSVGLNLTNYPTLDTIISFLAHILINEPIHQEEMIKTNGFQILGLLLEKVMRSNMSNPTFELNNLFIMAVNELLQSCSKNEVLLLSIYQNIIFNFNIWIYTNKDIQISLLKLALDKTINYTNYIRKFITVRSLLDSVKYYYAQNDRTIEKLSRTSPGTSSPKSSSGNKFFQSEATSNAYKLLPNDAKMIISYIFTLIEMIITSNSSDKDEIPEVQDLIEFVQDSTCDNIVIIETLSIFLKLLHYGSKGFLASFESAGDIKPLFGLLKRENEQIQVLTIKIIGKYLSKVNKQSKSKLSYDDTVALITESLKEFPMTDMIYRALAEIVIDKIAPTFADTPNSPLLNLVGDHERTTDFVNISALQSICSLATRASPSLQQQILNEISLCIKHIPNVRATIMECTNWQTWLLSMWPAPTSNPSSPPWSSPNLSPIITSYITPTSISLSSNVNNTNAINSSNSNNNNNVNSSTGITSVSPQTGQLKTSSSSAMSNRAFYSGIKEIITGIVKLLLNDCTAKKDGWKAIEETEAWISSLLPNGLPLERRIFYECLVKLEQDIRSPSNQSIVLKNYVNLISIIEDFVFSHTINILAHRNIQSQWEDFGLVAKLLDIFDYTQSIQTQKIPTIGSSSTLSPQSTGSTPSATPGSSQAASPYIVTLTNTNIDLPTIDISSGSSKAKNSINTILRFIMCIFQEAETCFYGERGFENNNNNNNNSNSNNNIKNSSSNTNTSEQIGITDLSGTEEDEKSFIIRVWGLPKISEEMDQIISKNSIRIQTILASEKDQREQVKHVMWVISILINIIRRYRDHHNDPILKKTQSIMVSLLKSLLKTYGELIDNYISPTNTVMSLADSIGKTIGYDIDGGKSNANASNVFAVHTIVSLNEPGDQHTEFLRYFKEKLLYKISLLDKLHEIKDSHENANHSSTYNMTRKSKVVEQIKNGYMKEQETLNFKLQKLWNKSFVSSQKMEINELQRRQQFELNLDSQRSWKEKLSKKSNKRITRERTPWGWNESSPATKKYYKIHNHENTYRQFRVLRRNFNGSDHQGAALRPSNPAAAISSPTIGATQQQEVDLLRKVAKRGGDTNNNMISSIENESLVGFEMDEDQDGNIVLVQDEQHENEWCMVNDGFTEPTNVNSNGLGSTMSIPNNSSGAVINQSIMGTTTSTGAGSGTGVSTVGPQIQAAPDKQIYTTLGEIISPMLIVRVHLTLFQSKQMLLSASNTVQEDAIPQSELKDRLYDCRKLIGIQHRRYLLLPTALELFFSDRQSIYINFPSSQVVAILLKHISSLCDPNVCFKTTQSLFDYSRSTPQQNVLKFLNPTQRWKRREISNFEYLMTLNTIAGRSYNDLNQYPVFPWIISDYSSAQLDLANPETYRDLTKPIGALNPTRLELFMERYQQCPKEIPAFMYGTHYSSSGSVMFFLMRSEPFTSHFIKLQSGHFDHADRMFDSIVDCWRNCLNSSSDVKELTPEFFYMPEFLINTNSVHFGVKQNGKALGDVVLPPWAKTPFHFIMLNRMALESEYVSQNLNHWIDLIFGFKQRGKEATAAHNLFYYLTYEGSVDVGAMQDTILREATRVQINNFGVTPSQLFQTPHVARDPPKQTMNRLSMIKMLRPLQMVSIPFSPVRMFMYSPNVSGSSTLGVAANVVSHKEQGDRVLILGANNDIQYLKISYDNSVVTNPNVPVSSISSIIPISIISQLNSNQHPLSISQSLRTRIGYPFCGIPNNHKILFASGKYEYTLYVIYNDSKLSIGTLCHKAPITCIIYNEVDRGERCGVGGVQVRQRYVVTGSDDTTAILWYFNEDDYSVKPIHVLRGHDYGITCVALDIDNDICLTGSKDGTIIIHSVNSGQYIRTIQHPQRLPIHNITLTEDGSIIFYSNSNQSLFNSLNNNNNNDGDDDDEEENENELHKIYRYSINGNLIQSASSDIQPMILKMVEIRSPNYCNVGYLLTAGGYQIVVRDLLNLDIVHIFDVRNLSEFINSNVIVDFSLWVNGIGMAGTNQTNNQDNQASSGSKGSQPNINQLSLFVLLESCQLVIYNIDDNVLRSLSD